MTLIVEVRCGVVQKIYGNIAAHVIVVDWDEIKSGGRSFDYKVVPLGEMPLETLNAAMPMGIV